MLEDPQKISTSKILNFLEKKSQKWLYWVLANTKRNKVMSFDEPRPNRGKMANKFMVGRAGLKDPPPGKIGLSYCTRTINN